MAVQAFDFKLTEGDLDFSTGDLTLTESSIEHLYALVNSVTNDYKLDSTFGVNLIQYLNSPLNSSVIELKRIIKSNMTYDGFSTDLLSVSGNLSMEELIINASGQRVK
jgi:hypothetical protein